MNPLQGAASQPGGPGRFVARRTADGRRARSSAYTGWLKKLRQVCDERQIVLIFDEVFVGFRLAPGGAKEYFGVQPDLITYGKTLGGGLPVGVVCGKSALMRRYRDDHPVDVCFARGTFNSHPYVMGAMWEFLHRLDSPEIKDLYRNLDQIWNGRTYRLNSRLQAAGLPVRVENLSSIWTTLTARFRHGDNWMLATLSAASRRSRKGAGSGTGARIPRLNFTDADFDVVVDRLVAACEAMRRDGWWCGRMKPPPTSRSGGGSCVKCGPTYASSNRKSWTGLAQLRCAFHRLVLMIRR